MAAGEHEIIDATDEVILLVGDSSACSFSINGIVARQAGKAASPRRCASPGRTTGTF